MNDIKREKVNIGRENITGNAGDLTRNNIEGDLANTNCQHLVSVSTYRNNKRLQELLQALDAERTRLYANISSFVTCSKSAIYNLL